MTKTYSRPTNNFPRKKDLEFQVSYLSCNAMLDLINRHLKLLCNRITKSWQSCKTLAPRRHQSWHSSIAEKPLMWIMYAKNNFFHESHKASVGSFTKNSWINLFLEDFDVDHMRYSQEIWSRVTVKQRHTKEK